MNMDTTHKLEALLRELRAAQTQVDTGERRRCLDMAVVNLQNAIEWCRHAQIAARAQRGRSLADRAHHDNRTRDCDADVGAPGLALQVPR